jgi:mannosyl-glycoprotein endo-beta-N-acetylglucosaminidase
MGAAKIISEKWINHSSASQSTLYAMRWNPMSPGQNQYATDIDWASKQAEIIYPQMNKMQQINPSYQPLFIVPKYYHWMR